MFANYSWSMLYVGIGSFIQISNFVCAFFLEVTTSLMNGHNSKGSHTSNLISTIPLHIRKLVGFGWKATCPTLKVVRDWFWFPFCGTVVSAYNPPGYKPTSASVPLKEFPDCFCYHLHSKWPFLAPPVVSTDRLQSSQIVPLNTQKIRL